MELDQRNTPRTGCRKSPKIMASEKQDKLKSKTRRRAKPRVHRVRDGDGKLVWAQKGVDPSHLPRDEWPYNDTTKELICMRIIEGNTLKAISEMDGYPSIHTMYTWMKKKEDFKKAVEEAKRFRADYHHDMMFEMVMNTKKKSDVPVNKLKMQFLQWSAEKHKPDQYGSKTVIEGNPDKPVQFIVNTGIRREIEDKTKETIDVTEHNHDRLPAKKTDSSST